MRTSTPVERPAAAAPCSRRAGRCPGGSPQYGPNVSVMPKRFGRHPGPAAQVAAAAPPPGCRAAATRGPRRRTRGWAASRGGLVGPAPEQRRPFALEQAERLPGVGSVSVSSVAPATSTVTAARRRSRPSRRRASGCRGAPPGRRSGRRVRPPRPGARCRGCGRPLRGARLPDVNMTPGRRRGGPASPRASTRAVRSGGGPRIARSSERQADVSAGSRGGVRPLPGASRSANSSRSSRCAAAEPVDQHEPCRRRRCAAAPRARAGAAGC